MWQGGFTFEFSWRGPPEAEATVRGHLVIMTMKRRQSIIGGCCSQCMLYSVYRILGANSWSRHGETQRDDLTLCSAIIVELWTRKREMGYQDENDVEDYKRIWEICGTTCLIGLGWPSIGVITHLIRTCTCCIVDGKLTRTWHSLVSDDDSPRTLSSLPFLSSILPSPKNTKLTPPSLSIHAMIKS